MSSSMGGNVDPFVIRWASRAFAAVNAASAMGVRERDMVHPNANIELSAFRSFKQKRIMQMLIKRDSERQY